MAILVKNKNKYSNLIVFHKIFLLGASAIFGLGVKFDDTNSNAKRLEV